MVKGQLIFLHILLLLTLSRQSKVPLKCRMTSLACDYDKAILTDVVCRFKSARYVFGTFNIGFSLAQPLDKISVEVHSYHKNSANRWLSGLVHIKTEICQMLGKSNNVFTKMIIELLGAIPPTFLSCPYEARMEVVNYTVESVDHILKYLPGLPSGDYKYVLTLYQGDNSNKVLELSFNEYCKLSSLNPTGM